ncbi:MAG: SpoIID/LytB domain-containing protein, partial [Elusimicrobiales bacterium]|nr:SpoIID/LytB domain-containing protein [Elusimicrobiales bacterium]
CFAGPAAEIPPKPDPPLFSQLVEEYYDGEFEAALKGFRKLVDHDPADDLSRRQLIRLYRESGDFQAARTQLLLLQDPEEADSAVRPELLELSLLSGASPGYSAGGAEDPEALFWQALAAYRGGDLKEAERLLLKTLDLESYNPPAHYLLGLIAFDAGRAAEAEEHLASSLKQEPNLTMALLPLARARLKLEKTASAHALLLRARAALPSSSSVANELLALEAAHPELTEKRESEAAGRREAAVPPVMKRFPAEGEAVPRLRVGLAEGLEYIHLKTGGEYRLFSGGQILSEGSSGEILTLRAGEAGIEVLKSGRVVAGGITGPLSLSYDCPGCTSALFDMEYGSGYYFAGFEDRYYRGDLHFSRREAGLTVVNIISLEEYLYSVVPSEIPAYWPEASLQAQAVAARSYTLANMGRFEGRGFDLYASVRSASYRGAGNEAERTSDAVDATRGLVLYQREKPLNAVYSANSGGYTEDSLSVWGFESLLQAVADPKIPERSAPLPPEELARWIQSRPESYSAAEGYHSRAAYRWRLWVPAVEIAARIDSRGESIGTILSLTSR